MTNEPEPNTRAREALKPCPFCGSPDIRHDHPNRAPRVYCSTCRVVAECPDSWNTRPLPQPSELVERPSEAIEVLGGPYRQLDMDGVIVGVSRQAIYETLTYLTQLEAQIAKLQADGDKLAGALEEAAKATPLGHENTQRGASTYNWLMSHARLIRKLGGGDAPS